MAQVVKYFLNKPLLCHIPHQDSNAMNSHFSKLFKYDALFKGQQNMHTYLFTPPPFGFYFKD